MDNEEYTKMKDELEEAILDSVVAIEAEEWDRLKNAAKISMGRHAGLAAIISSIASDRKKLVDLINEYN